MKQEKLNNFSMAVRLSAEIRKLEQALRRIPAGNAMSQAERWHRQMLERSLRHKRQALREITARH